MKDHLADAIRHRRCPSTRLLIASAIVTTAALAGCSGDTKPLTTAGEKSDLPEHIQAAVTSDPTLKLGFASYTRNCVGCHGIQGDGKGPASPRLQTQPRDLTTGVFKFRSTPNGQLPIDEDLHRTIRQGLPGSSMPAFEFLPERERTALVEFIKLYSDDWEDPEKVPTRINLPVKEPDDLASKERVLRGRYAYVSMGCNLCHGMFGRGDGRNDLPDDWGQLVQPYDFHRGTPKGGGHPIDIYRTFRSGVNPMPAYDSEALSYIGPDIANMVWSRVTPEEREILEPIAASLPTQAQVNDWKANDPARYEQHCTDRAWDLVAFTLWLRDYEVKKQGRPAAIWPAGRAPGENADSNTSTPSSSTSQENDQ